MGEREGFFPFELSVWHVRKVYAGKDAFGDGIDPKMSCCYAKYERKLGIMSQVLVI